MKRDYLILIFICFGCFSCNTYNNEKIAEIGNEYIQKYNYELKELILLTERIAKDDYVIYYLSFSNVTDGYTFCEYAYSSSDKKNKKAGFVSIDSEKLKKIKKLFPEEFSNQFVFMKNVYVSFRLLDVQNYRFSNSSLIYCYDKDSFLKIFPNFVIVQKDKLNSDVEGIDWIYFYNDNWAITISSDIPIFSKKECEKILTE